VTQGGDGNFYGTTYSGGAGEVGTIYMVTASGSLSTIYTFNGLNGADPQAGLTLGRDGVLYGTTYSGGAYGYGTVFSLAPFSVNATVGEPFTYQISAASNAPPSYSATNLPTGLSVDAMTGLISGTPTAIGATSVTIGAANAGGAGSATLVITVRNSFAAWQDLWFTQAQLMSASTSGEPATPAWDGIPNLLKYAFNLNPLASGISAVPMGSVMSIGGTNYLTLTYTQDIFAGDIAYIPEVSGDLIKWNSGPGYTAPVSVTPNGDGVTETVIVRDATPMGAAPRFIRLRVTGP
jgi:uncharacterized repeat protein (TIGR03803 family)